MITVRIFSRYVDTFEAEDEIDLDAIAKQLQALRS